MKTRTVLALPLLALLAPALLAQGTGSQCIVTAGSKVFPAGPEAGDWFGMDVDLSGTTLVVGSDWSSETGTAYVFERGASGTWVEGPQLFASDAAPWSRFGWSVAISGDTLVAGAQHDDELGYQAGAAYVFERDQGGPGNWGEVQKLLGAPPTASRNFGIDVALDGDTLLIGRAPPFANSSVEVWERSGTSWSMTTSIPAPLTASGFGQFLAIDGDTVVSGAPFPTTGFAFVYERDLGGPDQWGLRTQLAPLSTENGAYFGRAVSVLGDRAAVGAPYKDSDTGSTHVFERHQGGANAWGETHELRHELPSSGDLFGYSVALRSDTLLVGARAQGGQDSGAGYKFVQAGGTWTQVHKLKPGLVPFAWFGWRVAADQDYEVVTAVYQGGTVPHSGSAYVYSAPPPSEVTYCTSGATAIGCQAVLCTYGTASASAPSDFVVMGRALPGSTDGLFFFGTSGRQAQPWGNGTSFQCVVPPVSRGPLLTGTGQGNTCTGRLELDVNALWTAKPAKNPGAGALVQGQFWFRDPLNTSNQTTSLSHGIEFAVEP